jgi:hypothetical protein
MPQPARLREVLPGWAISLAVHAAALAWLVHAVPARHQDDTPVRRSTLVMVRLAPPPKPAQKPAEAAAMPVPRALTPSTPATPSRPRPARATVQAIVPAAVVAEPTPEPVPAAVSAESSDGAPALDMTALRASARAVVRSEAAAAPGTQMKATQDEKLGRDIDRSRRGDCQTKYAGAGILAVIPLAVATVTGTGCKWK